MRCFALSADRFFCAVWQLSSRSALRLGRVPVAGVNGFVLASVGADALFDVGVLVEEFDKLVCTFFTFRVCETSSAKGKVEE